MESRRTLAETVLRKFLAEADKSTAFDPDTSLYADGLGLDSLETAELSALLEDEVSSDPFSVGPMPETVGELLGFYDDSSAVSS